MEVTRNHIWARGKNSQCWPRWPGCLMGTDLPVTKNVLGGIPSWRCNQDSVVKRKKRVCTLDGTDIDSNQFMWMWPQMSHPLWARGPQRVLVMHWKSLGRLSKQPVNISCLPPQTGSHWQTSSGYPQILAQDINPVPTWECLMLPNLAAIQLLGGPDSKKEVCPPGVCLDAIRSKSQKNPANSVTVTGLLLLT